MNNSFELPASSDVPQVLEILAGKSGIYPRTVKEAIKGEIDALDYLKSVRISSQDEAFVCAQLRKRGFDAREYFNYVRKVTEQKRGQLPAPAELGDPRSRSLESVAGLGPVCPKGLSPEAVASKFWSELSPEDYFNASSIWQPFTYKLSDSKFPANPRDLVDMEGATGVHWEDVSAKHRRRIKKGGLNSLAAAALVYEEMGPAIVDDRKKGHGKIHAATRFLSPQTIGWYISIRHNLFGRRRHLDGPVTRKEVVTVMADHFSLVYRQGVRGDILLCRGVKPSNLYAFTKDGRQKVYFAVEFIVRNIGAIMGAIAARRIKLGLRMSRPATNRHRYLDKDVAALGRKYEVFVLECMCARPWEKKA